ncbi:MAG: VWA domain-containing protein [Acidobacteriota bacterium]
MLPSLLSDLHWADLRFAWVLAPLFVLWALLWPGLLRAALRRSGLLGLRQRASAAVRFSSLRHLAPLRPSLTLRLRTAVRALRFVVVALLLVAMLRPQTGRTLTQVSTEGVDIVLALDASGSMQALDLDADRGIRQRRNRLQVTKAVVEEFIEKRLNDQIGLVVFGAQAFTQCPLTLDHGIVATFLERIDIGIAGDATAIGSALGTAVKRLENSEAKSKVVVLLTDGRSNAGSISPRQAAEAAAALEVKVYTIGAGTRGKAPFLVDTLFGKQITYQDVEIDEEILQEIAETTGGEYFRAEDSSALSAIYERIDELEKTEITMESYMEYNERYRWFVLPAVALLLLEVLLLGTRFRKLP